MTTEFTHLHLHTEYSLLDGLCALDRGSNHDSPLMNRVAEVGQKSVAITDHGNLYGVIHFYSQARARGIHPILGCEVYVTPGDHTEKVLVNGRQANHLILLAENETGFHNLKQLVSEAHLNGMYYKPRIDRPLLAQHHEGLIALSACLKGEIAEALAEDHSYDKAKALAAEYADIMGKGNFFLELQDHGLPEQAPVNRQLRQLAKELGLPMVATNDVHYLRDSDEQAHEMLLCLQTQDKWSNPDRMKYGSDQFYLKSGDEMAALFSDVPEALSNTMLIAERCHVDIPLQGQKNPHFPIYKCPGGVDHKTYLTQLGREGIQKLYGVDIDHPADDHGRVVAERFWHEMDIIERTGFLNYFLVVWDFIHASKSMGIPVGPGRGSGAGSIVAYAIGITGIDPLRYNLFFERFLNPERVSPPDFDIDFCQTRRGEAIEYVKRKYGEDAVAQIITYGTLGAKTLFRDIGRALEIPLADTDRLAKLIPDDPKTTLSSALADSADFAAACKSDPYAREIMKFAPPLEGMPRQTGIHAAGVVIGDQPLIEVIPLSRDKSGAVISQWEAVPLEQAGFLKMDFLGLKTLTVIREACENVKANKGVEVDIDHIPLDDPETYKLLASGQTTAIFQVESEGMRDLLRKLQISKIEELIALIALYRPGPMQLIPDYIDCKLGKKPIHYPHPALEPVLKETYGVFVYQEQVQQAARVLAGFSLGQGDILRRAMGKKKPEVMAKERVNFVNGCIKTGTCDEKKAIEIFDLIAQFASYGFNKSHSAAYGIVTFQTAYLKAHYPVEFMAAMLSSEMGNTDKLPPLVAEARRMGIPVLPPDVNESGLRFTPVQSAIRYGLAGIKGVGEGAVEAIRREHAAHGPFTGFVDFCERILGGEVNRKVLEALIRCGAFDFTKMPRRQLVLGIEEAMSYATSRQSDKAAGQFSLFDMMGDSSGADDSSAFGKLRDQDLAHAGADIRGDDPAAVRRAELLDEKELTGFYISGHPLDEFAWTQKTFDLVTADALLALPERTQTRLSGLCEAPAVRIIKPKKPDDLPKKMISFALATLQGRVGAVAFSEACEKYGALLLPNAPVMICGSIRGDKNGGKSFSVDEVYPLDKVPAKFALHVTLHVSTAKWNPDTVKKLQDLLSRHPGKTPLRLCLHYPDNSKVYLAADDSWAVNPSESFIRDLTPAVDTIRVTPNPSPILVPRQSRWR